MSIEITGLYKNYGDKKVLADFNLTLPEMGVVALLGPSGCGKTTLLNILAGMEKADSGTIKGLQGKKISVVFQEDRLLPWSHVAQNLNMVVPVGGTQAESLQKVKEMLSLMELEDTGDKYPNALSGGMKRRIAIARALLFGGEVYLLDEPFKGLDNKIKQKIMDYIKVVSKDSLVVLITHDETEAAYLSDRIERL